METRINKIKQYFDTSAFDSEESVRTHICYPVLRELGWDVESPVHLIPEYKVSNLRVDIALCRSPGKPVVFIEVKAPGKCSPKGQKQVFEYAAGEGGIPMIIFTDGDEWHFYNSYGSGPYDSRKVKSLWLTKDNTDECIECFSRYLQYERVKSERAFDDLRWDHKQTIAAEEAKSIIPKAWNLLVDDDEDDMLIDIINEKVKEISDGAHVPEKADVVAFLQSLKAEYSPTKTTGKPAARPRHRKLQPVSEGAKSFYQYKINGEIQQDRYAIVIYLKVLDYVIAKFGRFEELKLQPLNRRKSRSLGSGYQMSEDKREIPVEEKLKTQLPNSKIWLHTSLSVQQISRNLIKIGEFYNQSENRKILDVWGSDAEVEFDTPARPSAL